MPETLTLRSTWLALSLSLALAGCGASASSANPSEPSGPAAEQAPRVAIPNARTPEPGLLTGGQPSRTDLEEARDAGFRTVVSLRVPGEPGSEGEAEVVEALMMRFVSIPVDGAEGLTRENAHALHEVLDDPDAAPVMVHCATGNRVGALLALSAYYFQDMPAEQALELGKAAGMTTLEPAVRTLLGL